VTSQYQASGKTNAGNIYVVGGENYDEFYGNVNALFGGDLGAVEAMLSEFRSTLLPIGEPRQLHQAASTVNRGFSQQAPPPSQPAAPSAPLCDHGVPREYKSGEKNGKTWAAWFCNGTRDRNEQCPPKWVGNS
jgi:hypothetical protein